MTLTPKRFIDCFKVSFLFCSFCFPDKLKNNSKNKKVKEDLFPFFLKFAEYEEKIEACKKKTEQAKSEVADGVEMEYLQKQLQEELEKERRLKEELR